MATHIPGPLYYEQQGKAGLPMVFLHSTPDDNRLWLFQTAHFSNWYRTIAVDLAGYGRSPAPQDGEDFTKPGAYKLRALIKGSEIVEMPSAGHTNCFEVPWEYGRQAIAYLKKRGLFPG